MIVKELAVLLGLDVNAASFAEGESFIEMLDAGLSVVVDTAADVANAFYENIEAAGGWAGDLGAAARKTEQHFEEAAEKAKTIQEYIGGQIRRLWAAVLAYVLPVIRTITDYVLANVRFYGQVFADVGRWIVKNWDTIKYALLAGITAVTAAMVILHWTSVKAAAASVAAWLAAAWPFILIGGLVAGILLALDDLRVYAEGGESLFGRWKKAIEEWLAPKKTDPEWLKSIKEWLSTVKEALTKKGALDGFFGSIKQFFVDIWARIKEIDWTPITRFFGWLADKVMEIDWKAWGKRLQDALVGIKDKVASVDFAAWLHKLEAVGRALYFAYLVAKQMVIVVGNIIDEIAGIGNAIASAPGAVKGLLARLFGGGGPEQAPGRAPAPSGGRAASGGELAPGDGVLLPRPAEQSIYEPTIASAADYERPLMYTSGRGGTQVTVKNENTFQVTQLPGEDGEQFARRVAAIVDERNQSTLDEAASGAPATE